MEIYQAFMDAVKDCDETAQASVQYLAAMSQIPCDECVEEYFNEGNIAEPCLVVLGTNDPKNIDLICNGRRGYNDPHSRVLDILLCNTVLPMNVEMATHIRQHWNHGMVYTQFLEDTKDYYDSLIEEGLERNLEFEKVLASFHPLPIEK